MNIEITGFNQKSFDFLKGLKKDNSKEYFDAHRESYQKNLIEPARLFIEQIGPFLNELDKNLRTEPKFNVTILRMNKDQRFSKGAPYREFLLLHFGKSKGDSEYFVYLDGSSISAGLFVNNTTGDQYFFKKALKDNPDLIASHWKRAGLDSLLDISTFAKEPKVLYKNAVIDEVLPHLPKHKALILEKPLKPTKNFHSFERLLPEVIVLFSKLYPIYAFAAYPNPEQMIETFYDRIGIPDNE